MALSFDGFCQVVEKNILTLDDHKKQQLKKYHDFLIEYNQKVNLISRRETDVYDRHFLNSVLALKFVSFPNGSKILDIGTGGGFPGMVLAILFPDSKFALADSIQKKAVFLRELAIELGVSNVEIIGDRIEKLPVNYKRKFNFITARAVASLSKLVSLSKPFLSEKGKMLFWKGRSYEEEIKDPENPIPSKVRIKTYAFSDLQFLPSPHDGALISVEIFS